ncbi:MAG: hypothetical protein RDV48_01810 [Candidatus Eremiobacteraeota bacterium]|nr:hypothetical protein [Candidatus Eremiobacteraeota bacterium]
MISFIEERPSQAALWLVPLLEQWSRVSSGVKKQWIFFRIASPAGLSALVILDQKDHYVIMLGDFGPLIPQVFRVVKDARPEIIIAEPGVFSLIVEHFPGEWCYVRVNLIYRLDPGGLLIAPDGRSREATEEDLPVLEKWNEEFLKEDSFWVNLSIDYRDQVRKGKVHVYEKEGKIVSCMRIPYIGKRIVKFSATYTPPEHRRKGYASQLNANVGAFYLLQGKSMISDPLESNQARIATLNKLGFKEVGRQVSLLPDWNTFMTP